MESSTVLVVISAADIAYYALAFFLVLVAVGLVYLLVKRGRAVGSADKMVQDVNGEVVPLLGKVQVTLDEVNAELDKVNTLTGTAIDMTAKVDQATRAVEGAIRTPAKKAAGFTAGAQQAVSSFMSRFRGGAVPMDETAARAQEGRSSAAAQQEQTPEAAGPVVADAAGAPSSGEPGETTGESGGAL